MKLIVFLSLMALITGALIPVQAAANAALSQSISSVGYSALLLFVLGFICVALFLIVNQVMPPSLSQLLSAPSYGYIGGLIVATYVLSITYLAPRMGVGNAIFFIVTGQIIAAVLIDQFGLMGVKVFELNWQRLVGVVLMIGGLFMARS